MSVLLITSGIYSNAKERVEKLSNKLNCRIITDNEIIEKTAAKHNIKEATIQKVVESRKIAFNDFTHENEKCTACLKKTIAEHIAKGDCIFHGFTGHLIPEEVSHVMRVLIITDKETRIQNGITALQLSEKEITKNIAEADKHAFLWTNTIAGKKAWDNSLYDVVIPTDKIDTSESVNLIIEQVEKISDISENIIKKESSDFELTASVEIALSEAGKGLFAEADNGNIVVTIDKKVLMLSSFQQKVINLAQNVPGVKSVETKIGKNYYKTNIIHNYDFETPMRILLVDDEKEFVQTLSERLKMRQFTSEIAFNGEEALEFTSREDTEVMVLDLKMPGIDGLEVLKKVKQTKPDIEVIILTGHGSDEDRKKCMELGAFAYLQKPADIDLLTSTMQQAYEKINIKKNLHAAD